MMSMHIYWTVSVMLPRVTRSGLLILSMSSSLTMELPMPPWMQRMRFYVCLSRMTAPRGIHSNKSLIFWNTEFGSSMFSLKR